MERTAPWERDTITNVWSTTKTVTSLAALMLVDRGELDVYAPVAVLARVRRQRQGGHRGPPPACPTPRACRAGQPAVVEDLYDWDKPTARLAAQAPWWEPGTASGYHALEPGPPGRRGHPPGHGQPLRTFVAEEIAGPLGADFQIGAAERTWPRIAPVVPPPPLPFDLAALDPDSADGQDPHRTGRRRGRGQHAGVAPRRHRRGQRPRQRPLGRPASSRPSPSAARSTASGCCRPGHDRPDLRPSRPTGSTSVLGIPLRFGIGYGLPQPDTVPYIPTGRVCFWGGWGGSVIIMDLDRRLTISLRDEQDGARHHRLRPQHDLRRRDLRRTRVTWVRVAGRSGHSRRPGSPQTPVICRIQPRPAATLP